MNVKLLITGIGLLILHGQAAAEPNVFEMYDNFNTKKYNGCKGCIDSSLWRGGERGDSVEEIERDIKGKRAYMSHISWGRADSDEGSEQGRNRFIFRDSEYFSGVCFTPRVKKYRTPACDANDGHSQARIRYLGSFYDTDNADDGGEDGIVYAGIELQRGTWTDDKKGIFEINGWVSECEGAGCEDDAWSTYDGIDDPDLTLGSTKAAKNKKPLCLAYDRVNHEIVFSYGNTYRWVNMPDHGLPVFDDDVAAENSWHVIETRTDVVNCSERQEYGSIQADFDNVEVQTFAEPIR